MHKLFFILLLAFFLSGKYPVTDLRMASLTLKENKENSTNYAFFFSIFQIVLSS